MVAVYIKVLQFSSAQITMSTLTEMKELLDLGTKMGLTDEAFKRFVHDEQNRMRDEREK